MLLVPLFCSSAAVRIIELWPQPIAPCNTAIPLPRSFDGAAEVGYEDVMGGGRPPPSATVPPSSSAAAAVTPPPHSRRGGMALASATSPGTFEDVPLRPRGPLRGGMGGGGLHGRASPSAGSYKLKVFTTDRLNAGLGNTTVR